MRTLLQDIPEDLVRLVASEIPAGDGPGLTEHSICGLTDNSRKVEPGYIFVAIRGTQHDGHRFLHEAHERGARVAVVDHIRASDPPLTYLLSSNTRRALSHLASAFFDHPSRKLTVCGITGTNGKTTTSAMIHTILREDGQPTGLTGTVCNHIGSEMETSSLTTPEAPEIYRLLERMVSEGMSHAVMEISSHGLEQKRVDAIELDAAVITNITPDHIEHHQDFASYIRTKARILDLLVPGGFVVNNADDQQTQRIASALPDRRRITFGLENKRSMIGAEELVSGNLATSFQLTFDPHAAIAIQHTGQDVEAAVEPLAMERGRYGLDAKMRVPVKLNVPGRYNVYNALAAAAACLGLGLEPGTIARGLAAFRGVRRRFQVLQRKPYLIIDDFAHNPDGIANTIQEAAAITDGQLVIVYALRGNRGPDINAGNARALARAGARGPVKRIIGTLSSSHVDEKDQVRGTEIAAYLEIMCRHRVHTPVFPELRPALRTALSSLSAGDTLLLLGAQGMEEGARILEDLTEDHELS